MQWQDSLDRSQTACFHILYEQIADVQVQFVNQQQQEYGSPARKWCKKDAKRQQKTMNKTLNDNKTMQNNPIEMWNNQKEKQNNDKEMQIENSGTQNDNKDTKNNQRDTIQQQIDSTLWQWNTQHPKRHSLGFSYYVEEVGAFYPSIYPWMWMSDIARLFNSWLEVGTAKWWL